MLLSFGIGWLGIIVVGVVDAGVGVTSIVTVFGAISGVGGVGGVVAVGGDVRVGSLGVVVFLLIRNT